MLKPYRDYLTIEEYLWEEERAESKHDYHNGQVYNMAGGSIDHSQIAVNVVGELRTILRGGACRVFNSDLKIAVSGAARPKGKKRRHDDEFICYPDATVLCGEPEFYRDDRQTLANPTILFEVLSPSTHKYDRNTKLEQYKKIPSLLAYIIIDSEEVWVEKYRRIDSHIWQSDEPLEDITGSLEIESLNISIPLTAIYEGIDFEEVE